MYGAYHRISTFNSVRCPLFQNFVFWDIRARPLCVGFEVPPFAPPTFCFFRGRAAVRQDGQLFNEFRFINVGTRSACWSF